ncbi:Fructosamine/Ketosamine-3-kinase [Rhodopirellula maiorica SM1]|uniref:Fructosamine/Ketosamine-3-kinase n=2 Tax=Novipirellula TaxID=2795426 RepID=M5RR27_9BACT|nr:Fructosamine/Ketosamine-3-kinase [Rhodopirellula maiorica SM1]
MVFAKSNDPGFIDNFQSECDGLTALAAADTILVPKPIEVGVAAERAWLITEWVETRPLSPNFFADFGRQLAELHRVTAGSQIGWRSDNFVGSAVQPNTATASWADFVAENRIGFQLRWAIDQQRADAKLRRDVAAIAAAMPELLAGRADDTSLLHGDLWSGNYLCGSGRHCEERHCEGRHYEERDREERDGECHDYDSRVPVILDPAVYYGCREAEFGMLKLFGSCPPEFYDAYQSTWPLPDGWQRRTNVYVLYHLLNHLNLFGGGYLAQCHQVASEILRMK